MRLTPSEIKVQKQLGAGEGGIDGLYAGSTLLICDKNDTELGKVIIHKVDRTNPNCMYPIFEEKLGMPALFNSGLYEMMIREWLAFEKSTYVEDYVYIRVPAGNKTLCDAVKRYSEKTGITNTLFTAKISLTDNKRWDFYKKERSYMPYSLISSSDILDLDRFNAKTYFEESTEEWNGTVGIRVGLTYEQWKDETIQTVKENSARILFLVKNYNILGEAMITGMGQGRAIVCITLPAKYRGKGLGRALLFSVLIGLRNEGRYSQVTCAVNEDDRAAMSICEWNRPSIVTHHDSLPCIEYVYDLTGASILSLRPQAK